MALNFGQRFSDVLTLAEARANLENEQIKQSQKVTQSLALRAAQAKYVLSRLAAWGDPFQIRPGNKLFPPIGAQSLQAYGENALAWHEKEFQPLWEKALQRIALPARAEAESFVREWQSLLEEMRRTTMQNWVHSSPVESMRELEKLESHVKEFEALQQKYMDARHVTHTKQNDLRSAEEELQSTYVSPEYETVRRLMQSRSQLNQQKLELEQQWMNAWTQVKTVFEIIENDSAALERMTHAQQEWLHTYVKNPMTARARDAHAHGLKVLVERALEEVKRGEWPLPEQQLLYFERNLQQQVETRFFETFFWQNNQLDAALLGNQKMVMQHPLHRKMQELEERVQQFSKTVTETQAQMAVLEQMLEEKHREIGRELDELNARFQARWKWVIKLEL